MPSPASYPRAQTVSFTGGFWRDRTEINRTRTIPHVYRMLQQHGRLQGWDLAAGDYLPDLQPHRFWDSDCTKWIEAAAYSLARVPDAGLETQVDDLIARMARAQQPDGYLNIVGILGDPSARWTNLRDHHELYCAGHLIEAAVAHEQATGKTSLRTIADKLLGHIDAVIGPEDGKIPGYPGHPEIEWALLRYFRHTGDTRARKLAGYFLEQRGQTPHFYDAEAKARREDTTAYFNEKIDYRYLQAHLPVREQTTVEGHAVRAMYLYTAMAAYACEKGDEELHQVCRRLWQNLTTKRMYLTGGIGSNHKGERFTVDYDLPNEQGYCETCAAIGLIFFAQEMFRRDPHVSYADVVERVLFNAVLPGVALDGTKFFYDNPLAVHPPYATYAHRFPHQRYPWHACACCPPNAARLLASIDQAFVSTADETVYLTQFGQYTTTLTVQDQRVALTMTTAYPWRTEGFLRLTMAERCRFTLALRKPAWSATLTLLVNDQVATCSWRDGFACVHRIWQSDDVVQWAFDSTPQWIEAHPSVRQTSGQVALQRGPLVYCVESCDHPEGFTDLHVRPGDPLELVEEHHDDQVWPFLQGTASYRPKRDWEGQLYRPVGHSVWQETVLRAVPFFMWGNRDPGAMRVWLQRRD